MAALDNPEALREAFQFHGVNAVINAAGSCSETTSRVVEAALSAGVPYLNVAAEPDIVAKIIEDYEERAQCASLALAPGIGFYGGDGRLAASKRDYAGVFAQQLELRNDEALITE
jgi:short subunit dehydrogenase-like uncharacterized protein